MINSADFLRAYRTGDCSFFLLRVILVLASLHASEEVLSDSGFANRSAAATSLFCKAKLLHDYAAEEDLLNMLQGSIILCMLVLDYFTDWDFGYWFHNAIRLATKINLRNMYVSCSNVVRLTERVSSTDSCFDSCAREEKPRKLLRLYRRIWWALYVRSHNRGRVSLSHCGAY